VLLIFSASFCGFVAFYFVYRKVFQCLFWHYPPVHVLFLFPRVFLLTTFMACPVVQRDVHLEAPHVGALCVSSFADDPFFFVLLSRILVHVVVTRPAFCFFFFAKIIQICACDSW